MRAPLPQGWELRLAAEIEAASRRRWEWGAHDCATLAWRCARAALDGPTRWDHLVGSWTSADGAARTMRQGGGLIAIMDRAGPRVDAAHAQRGDVAAVRLDAEGWPDPFGRAALGVVTGVDICVAADPGVARVALAACCAVWPLGVGDA